MFNKLQVKLTNVFTWEELSSSAACDEAERDSSDWPRDATLPLPFSNLPLPLLWGGDASESLATPPSSSMLGKFNMMNFLVIQSSPSKQDAVNREKVATLKIFWRSVPVFSTINSAKGNEISLQLKHNNWLN